MPQITQRYVDTGEVLLVFWNHPLEAHHPFALSAAAAATCAGRRGRFWQMHDALFRNQDRLDPPGLLSLAATVGLDDPPFRECLAGAGVAAVRSESSEAARFGVREDPALLIGRLLSGGRIEVQEQIAGVRPLNVYTDVIDRLVAQGKRNRR